jgi:Cu(I)/Ag(I) efflux system membrane fusion protein
MKTRNVTLLVLAGAAALAGGAFACRARSPQHGPAATASAAQRYRCPMHPSFVADRPGDCPICGMKLVAFTATPQGSPTPVLPGRAVVSLSPERRRMLGLQTVAVRVEPLARRIRTSGRVAVDERRLHHVHTKYEAYVEHLYVDFVGRPVRKGEPLVSLYSPELLAAQEEYLLAGRARGDLARSTVAEVSEAASGLLDAARQRLRLWDVRDADIARLEATGEAQRTLDLHSPAGGYVVGKAAYHGMRVTPADTLFDIADLSSVWVLADVYESDLAAVRVGLPAEVALTYVPGAPLRATVTNVAPTVDDKTRTVQVRLEVDNREGRLKPEMFADVVLSTAEGDGLVVPESAVVHTGERDLVFVARPDGRLEPRAVRLGGRAGAGREVRAGVQAGENVVTPANFLLDSESSLRAALEASAASAPAHH